MRFVLSLPLSDPIHRRWYRAFCLLLVFLPLAATGADPQAFPSGVREFSEGLDLALLEDPTGELTTDPEGLREVAERIRLAVLELGMKHVSAPPPSVITVSVGGACTASAEVHSARDLLARADAMLYAARRGGRNRVEMIPASGH